MSATPTASWKFDDGSVQLGAISTRRLPKAVSGSLESWWLLLWLHGSPGDAKHRPETREDALLRLWPNEIGALSHARACRPGEVACRAQGFNAPWPRIGCAPAASFRWSCSPLYWPAGAGDAVDAVC